MRKSRPLSFVFSALLAGMIFVAAIPAQAGLDDGIAAWKKRDFETAFKLLAPLAKEGNPTANYLLGEMFRDGNGVPQLPDIGNKKIKKAADQGLKKAAASLGWNYLHGNDVPKDLDKAFHYLTAGLPHPEAHFGLAQYYSAIGWSPETRDWSPEEKKLSTFHVMQAARMGYPEAMRDLAHDYCFGHAVPKSRIDSLAWGVLWRLSVADRNHESPDVIYDLRWWQTCDCGGDDIRIREVLAVVKKAGELAEALPPPYRDPWD